MATEFQFVQFQQWLVVNIWTKIDAQYPLFFEGENKWSMN
jgi:hypothetical protein